MDVEYDPKKAQINWQKHGVSFAEAEFVFYDPLAVHDIDPDASEEERFIALGMSSSGLLLVIVYTIRGDAFRLISARRATRQEAKAYEG
ncbi:BrnT family toxin (plasmid) [Euhalothece natronophila Z-M001]|uniref:BrnT family toxin n=1 Tax=Euhalothece natronophila Z-M001 TaxID=522448 RepID=A0A5B8NQK8_9CHRO|nr:BrnT family toxin [Euhalothece natronophila]QDZ41613.1 BrnT family toxin [Euhalothece natronophila Z-M001]QDZ41671.1 BrnT family toxin [Euhalothece natronophila Z-M001]